jgi:hypothetical protein
MVDTLTSALAAQRAHAEVAGAEAAALERRLNDQVCV